MKFYSTNNKLHRVSLKEAVIKGLAPDNGLYMPEKIEPLSRSFFDAMPGMSFQEIGFTVASQFVEGDISKSDLKTIVEHTVSFDAPLVEVSKNINSLELFHGPTMAFKDFGARFMSQVLGYFVKQENREVTVLVATSGDTGSAVANGFFNVDGVQVIVLYPAGKVSDIQEKQFTTLGKNVTALEVDGTFDDCQQMVKTAFLDRDLQSKLFLTSANSINISRLIPQSFYYFYAWSRLLSRSNVVFSVPSGNFGNLTAGLIAQRLGLPIEHFIASTNANDVVPKYLKSGKFQSMSSISTISNAMDVGTPSNFARMVDLFGNDWSNMLSSISGYSFTDGQTREVMRKTFIDHNYILDPHGAVGLLGLKSYVKTNPNVIGVFLETAHPAKFKDVVEDTLKTSISIPDQLNRFLNQEKKSERIGKNFGTFKEFLLNS